MGGYEFLAILLMLATLQPVIRQRLLEASRQRLIARIERQRGSRVILLVHRQETMGLLGFPIMRYIDVNDSEQVLRAIKMTEPDMPIDLVLQTPGGLILAASQIARAIRLHQGKVTVVVPHYAMSGGTLIALAADQILMSPHAVLGPVDPQINQLPAASILRVVDRKPIERIDDQTLILADVSRMAIQQVKAHVQWLLQDKVEPAKAEHLAGLLSEGCWTHDHPLTLEMLAEWGLPVSDQIPTEFLDLMSLYPQPVRRESAVEYLPVPRHRDDSSPTRGQADRA